MPLLQQRVAQARETVRKAVVAVPGVATWAEERLVACDRQVEDFANMITRGDERILCQDELSRRLQAEIATVETRVNLRADFEPVRLQTQTAENTSSDLVVGFASSMEKVLPRSVLPETAACRRRLALPGPQREGGRAGRRAAVRARGAAGPGAGERPAHRGRRDASPLPACTLRWWAMWRQSPFRPTAPLMWDGGLT